MQTPATTTTSQVPQFKSMEEYNESTRARPSRSSRFFTFITSPFRAARRGLVNLGQFITNGLSTIGTGILNLLSTAGQLLKAVALSPITFGSWAKSKAFGKPAESVAGETNVTEKTLVVKNEQASVGFLSRAMNRVRGVFGYNAVTAAAANAKLAQELPAQDLAGTQQEPANEVTEEEPQVVVDTEPQAAVNAEPQTEVNVEPQAEVNPEPQVEVNAEQQAAVNKDAQVSGTTSAAANVNEITEAIAAKAANDTKPANDTKSRNKFSFPSRVTGFRKNVTASSANKVGGSEKTGTPASTSTQPKADAQKSSPRCVVM